jgi:hypothetical protein
MEFNQINNNDGDVNNDDKLFSMTDLHDRLTALEQPPSQLEQIKAIGELLFKLVSAVVMAWLSWKASH